MLGTLVLVRSPALGQEPCSLSGAFAALRVATSHATATTDEDTATTQPAPTPVAGAVTALPKGATDSGTDTNAAGPPSFPFRVAGGPSAQLFVRSPALCQEPSSLLGALLLVRSPANQSTNGPTDGREGKQPCTACR